MFTNHYNFNNLPTFTSSKIDSKQGSNNINNTSFNGENSFINSSSIPCKVELPFVPSKHYPVDRSFFRESRLLPPQGLKRDDSNPSVKRIISNMPKHPLFGNRLSSRSSDKANFLSTHNEQNEKVTTDLLNTQTELISLAENLGYLLYVIFFKAGMWMLWVLNFMFMYILEKVRNIPNPEWKSENDADMVAESTPVTNKTVVLPFSNDLEHGKETKNPLFHKKLKSINNSVNEKLEHERQQMEMELEKEKQKYELGSGFEKFNNNSELSVIERKSPAKQYGTYFFHEPSKTPNPVNLESCYLKTAMSPLFDKNSNDIYQKASAIKNNLLSIYNANARQDTGNRKPTKPSFTRSTSRFQDLEWLIDDREDYLNNLESTRIFKEYQNILAERKKMQQLLHLSKLKESGLGVRPLTKSCIDEVEDIWMNQPEGVLINKYRIKITSRDIFTLSDRHWLNDNVIDFYLQLVKDFVTSKGISKVHVFSTFFYTTLKNQGYNGVRKWAKRAKVDVSELDYIFVPVNLNQTHWALALIDNVNQRFQYIDSMYSDGTDILYALVDYMTEETKKNHGETMNGKNYHTYNINGESDSPSQQNGFDCGVFACTAVDYLARNRELDYSQGDMPTIRRRMAWEILHGQLLDH